jgi:hypothetical protein
MPPRRTPVWIVAITAAFVGSLLVILLGVLGVRPIGWAVLTGALSAEALGVLYGRRRAFRPAEVAGFTFACMLLEWPLVAIALVFVRYWVTGKAFDQ